MLWWILACFVQPFSSCGAGGFLYRVHELLIAVASLVSEHSSDVHGLPQLRLMGLVAPRHAESSETRDETCVLYAGRWFLIHWTIRKSYPIILEIRTFTRGLCVAVFLYIFFFNYYFLRPCSLKLQVYFSMGTLASLIPWMTFKGSSNRTDCVFVLALPVYMVKTPVDTSWSFYSICWKNKDHEDDNEPPHRPSLHCGLF